MSGIYDMTLAAAAAGNIAALGSFVKVASAPNGSVRVKLDGGEGFTLLEGQGVRLPDGKAFRDVQVTNLAASSQTVSLFIGDSRFEDTRITGTVSVVDGGKARTIAGQAFIGYISGTAGGGQMCCFQLANPAGSGKRVVIKRFLGTCTIAGSVNLSSYATVLPTTGAVNPKLLGSVSALSAIVARDFLAAAPGSQLAALTIAAATVLEKAFEEPIVLAPGQGFVVTFQALACTATVFFEGIEEANT